MPPSLHPKLNDWSSLYISLNCSMLPFHWPITRIARTSDLANVFTRFASSLTRSNQLHIDRSFFSPRPTSTSYQIKSTFQTFSALHLHTYSQYHRHIVLLHHCPTSFTTSIVPAASTIEHPDTPLHHVPQTQSNRYANLLRRKEAQSKRQYNLILRRPKTRLKVLRASHINHWQYLSHLNLDLPTSDL